MTRTEFLDNINEWWELVDFCNDEGCYVCEDLFGHDCLDEQIENDISEALSNNDGWQTIRDCLNEIDTDYSYYRNDGFLNYIGLDADDFSAYKDDVLEWGDNNGVWEDEEEYEEEYREDVYEEEDEEEPAPEEAFQFTELMTMCVRDVRLLQEEQEEQEIAEDHEFDRALTQLLPLF